MTSLDASGFSITLLGIKDDALSALDATTSAIGWGQSFSSFQAYNGKRLEESQESSTNETMSTTGPQGLFE